MSEAAISRAFFCRGSSGTGEAYGEYMAKSIVEKPHSEIQYASVPSCDRGPQQRARFALLGWR
jgi:hypothetical protein